MTSGLLGIGEVGMLSLARFRDTYGVYAELQYVPKVVLEGDLGQLPPPTPSQDDARSCSFWSNVRKELRRQHRCADDALKAFACSIRASRPSQQAVDAFFAQLTLTDQVDDESVMAARAFVGDGLHYHREHEGYVVGQHDDHPDIE